ncbi:helix-turn-helix transcriptional regulator [Streptosporangium sp. NBC_01755]|uniref:helix-turn-helix domain-containing protein n=1 Tax=unclassified Streptosporangium TaxID=2632669 RepID=UPI002DDB28F4|nr:MULTISPECIES: helix-turn-helix transcriptional regulator [unclassified Streptosporangium]WSA23041.1 helix-turn-helix transcriptional regulator [Streptosporangium sp. NBC_01810]WSC98815.1 helix-turn-helix transcriptional regulator [Streptosporangium sp. NBC_01755]
MPPSRELDSASSPLAFFAMELRRLREQAELTQEQLAQEISYSTALVSMVETGKRNPSRDFTRRCDERLNSGGLLMRIWPLLANTAYSTQFQPWLEIELHAHALRTWQPLLVPGLLQTADYARAILSAEPGVTAERVEELVTGRLDRQKVLRRENPLLLWAVIGEEALHLRIGGPEVMRDQIAALITATENNHISVQVVPRGLDGPSRAIVGLEGGFLIASAEGSPDSVFVESAAAGHVTDHPRDVTAICKRYEAIRSEALPVRTSVDLLAKVVKEWQQT